MSLAVDYFAKLTVVETIEDEFVSPADATFTVDQLNTEEALNASSTPPVTMQAAFTVTLSGGAYTIDFTVLPHPAGPDQDATGLKLQLIRLRNPSANANNITITQGASNGYIPFGSAETLTLRPGEEILWRGYDAAADVDATHKTLDVSGTGSQTLQVQLIFG